MDNRQWKLLRTKLQDEILDPENSLLKTLNTANWDKETNRKADAILSRRATELLTELTLPAIPKDHKLFAKLWFKKDNTMKISVYHVPWNQGRNRAPAAGARKPVSLPLKAEDPLGVMNDYIEIIENNDFDYIRGWIEESAEGLRLRAIELKEFDRKPIVPTELVTNTISAEEVHA